MPEPLPVTRRPEKGEITAIMYGDRVITIKDKCSCGGMVHVVPGPGGNGKIATCQTCGAELKWGMEE